MLETQIVENSTGSETTCMPYARQGRIPCFKVTGAPEVFTTKASLICPSLTRERVVFTASLFGFDA